MRDKALSEWITHQPSTEEGEELFPTLKGVSISHSWNSRPLIIDLQATVTTSFTSRIQKLK